MYTPQIGYVSHANQYLPPRPLWARICALEAAYHTNRNQFNNARHTFPFYARRPTTERLTRLSQSSNPPPLAARTARFFKS
jgi:hypothetical protein